MLVFHFFFIKMLILSFSCIFFVVVKGLYDLESFTYCMPHCAWNLRTQLNCAINDNTVVRVQFIIAERTKESCNKSQYPVPGVTHCVSWKIKRRMKFYLRLVTRTTNHSFNPVISTEVLHYSKKYTPVWQVTFPQTRMAIV